MSNMSPSPRIRSLFDLLEAFPTEQHCIEHLARKRWPNGEECPWCGTTGRAYRIGQRWKCSYCKKFFSVRKGTLFEESRLPLRKWFIAIFLFVSSRKGIPSHQLARDIGVEQRTAWFMLSRLRQVSDKMAVEALQGIIEVDECFIGGRFRGMHSDKRKANRLLPNYGKQVVAGAVERDGLVRTDRVLSRDQWELGAFIMRRIVRGSEVHTDDHGGYNNLSQHQHHIVNHSAGEYVNGNTHTQTIESFWAIIKRAHKGVYHWWSAKHFDLYLREFEMRWNLRQRSEGGRFDIFLANVNGTRLSYEDLTSGRRKRPRRPYERHKRLQGQRQGRHRTSVRRHADGHSEHPT